MSETSTNNSILKFIGQNTQIEVSDHQQLTSLILENSLWKGIGIVSGSVYVATEIADYGDFLHDLGHIATVPKRYRQYLTGNFDDAVAEKILSAAQIESDDYHYLHYGCDDSATYWGFLACKYLNLDPLPLFNNYGDESKLQHEVCELSYGTKSQSRFSTALYHSQLLSSPRSTEIIAWDIENL